MSEEEHDFDVKFPKEIRDKLMKRNKKELIKLIDDLITMNKLSKQIMESFGIDI